MNRTRGILTGLISAALAAGTVAGSTGAQADSALAPLLGPDVTKASGASQVVPDNYIVVLKDGVRASAVTPGVSAQAVSHRFSHALNGYSAKLSASQLADVRQDPDVAYVERDQVIRSRAATGSEPRAVSRVSSAAASLQTNVGSWGLDRMDQRKLPLNGTYYAQDGETDAGTVWVVNDGIFDRFTSLAIDESVDLVGGSTTGEDCQILGTFLAHVATGMSYGVAKRAPVGSVRVADCDGNTTTSLLITGLEWVLSRDTMRTGVVDLGIQTPSDQAVDDAATKLIQAGIPVVSGAFHETGFDACSTSPTEVAGVINVSGTTNKDGVSARSATGTCVDIWAPAKDVVSVIPPPPGESGEWIATWDSPDVAAAFVAGAIIQYKRWQARYQPGQKATPAQIMAALTAASTKGVLTGVPAGTTSNLAFSKFSVPLPPSTTGKDRLAAGQNLVRDGKSRLTSKAGKYYLQYRASDGHLCLYTAATGSAHWCFGHSTAWANLHANGTLGQYDGYGQKIETSGAKAGTSVLVVSDNGYIYTKLVATGKATWSSPH